jgi:hypothetical protein
VLHIGHDPAKPWTAHCHNMATSPAEYLNPFNDAGDFQLSLVYAP